MDYQSELGSLETSVETSDVLACREFRLYRPDGTLSVVYFATFDSDAEAISNAERIARHGYQVDIWRDGMRINRVSVSDVLDTSDHQ